MIEKTKIERQNEDISYQNQFLWRPDRLGNLDKAVLSEPPLDKEANVFSPLLTALRTEHGLDGELAVSDDDLPSGLAGKE